MPAKDRTGPYGEGPMTGWCMGRCNCGANLGRNVGRGFGRRFRTRMLVEQQPITEKEEKNLLSDELKELEIEKKEIEKRLSELK